MLELLISLGIIGVLAVLVLGAVAKMQASAQNAGCLSNLRTLSQACLTYAAEHNNRLPFHYRPGDGWSGYGSPLWYIIVAPYVGATVTTAAMGELAQPGPFGCPADKIPWVGGNPRQFSPSCSYAFPIALASRKPDWSENNGDYVNLVARVPKPSKSVLLIDSAYGNVFNTSSFSTAAAAANDPQETGPELVKRHQGHLNAVFVDGHCEAISGNTPSFDANRPHLWSNYPPSLW